MVQSFKVFTCIFWCTTLNTAAFLWRIAHTGLGLIFFLMNYFFRQGLDKLQVQYKMSTYNLAKPSCFECVVSSPVVMDFSQMWQCSTRTCLASLGFLRPFGSVRLEDMLLFFIFTLFFYLRTMSMFSFHSLEFRRNSSLVGTT